MLLNYKYYFYLNKSNRSIQLLNEEEYKYLIAAENQLKLLHESISNIHSKSAEVDVHTKHDLAIKDGSSEWLLTSEVLDEIEDTVLV